MARINTTVDLRESGEGDDHGRDASGPEEIPAAGWKEILLRTKDEVRDDHVGILAAGVAFYLILSLFPFALAALSLYGLLANPSDVIDLVDRFRDAVPTSVADLVEDQLRGITEQNSGGLTFGLVGSVLVALWSASKGAKALIEATNIAFDEDETRGFVRLRLLALGYTVAFLVVLLAAVAVIAFLPTMLDDFGEAGRWAFSILRWPLLAVIAIVGLAAAYRYAPDRDNPKWRWVSWGAVVATVCWLAGSALFALYARYFGSYNETYGSVSAIVVLMLWFFVTAFAVLLGAEINAATEHQTTKDSTVGPAERMGDRGAYVADTVAEPSGRSGRSE